MGLLKYKLNPYDKVKDIPEYLKPYYTDSEATYNSQIKFPCIFCKKIIYDYQTCLFDNDNYQILKSSTSFSRISNYQVDRRTEFFHECCKPEGFRLSDISEYMPLYPKPQKGNQKRFMKDQSLQLQPNSDKKQEDFEQIYQVLKEYPRTKPQLHRDTKIDKLTIGWRVWDHHTNTEEFNQKSGKKQRLSESFCNIGKAPRGVDVIGLSNHKYPETAISYCKNVLKYTFNEKLQIAEG